MPDHELNEFVSGTHNLLNDEQIPPDAAQDEKNWLTQDGRLILIPGRLRIGVEGPVGGVQGEIFGYKIDGTKVHWRKIGTTIQYFDGAVWQTTVSGLTANADYTFCNYSSLAGTFTFAFGIDGIFKFHNACPTSYLSLYDPLKNFKGYAFIDRGRTILWNRPEDKTGLYGSYIDPQDSTVYTSVVEEALATGDGSTKTFSGTLGVHSGGVNSFGLNVFGQIAATKTITNITQGSQAEITATAHGFSSGDKIHISGVVGMTQINGNIGTVVTVVDPNHFFCDINSTAFTPYSSSGNVYKIEQFTDNYLGSLKSNLGGTGTINYLDGAYTLVFNTAPTNASNNILANYQWEASNNKGVTDFTHSATRLAGEGFQFPQDEGGDAILNVLIGQDGNYYSLKSQSAYTLSLDTTDTGATNIVYRRNMGVPFFRAAVSTGKGIVFLNTANPERPELTILQRNVVGGDIEPVLLVPQFKFANYVYDDCNIDTWERYVILCCKSQNATANDTILLIDLAQNSVDITAYNARTSATDQSKLYIGSSITQTVYQLYSGFDDDGLSIDNYWIGRGESLRPKLRHYIPDFLKKVRKLRLRGRIDPDQYYEIYISYDDAGFQLFGTVRGDGTYVDNTTPQEIGADFIGQSQIDGDVVTRIFPYFTELKLKAPKFRKRTIKLIAKGIGYVDVEATMDQNITMFETKLPKRFRQMQNVSLDGKTNDLPTPQY